MGAGAHLGPALGIPGLRAVADVAFLPASSVGLGPRLTQALQLTGGVVFAPSNGALQLHVAYRFERYDIAADDRTGERYEQFTGIYVGAGLRLGREPGAGSR